MKLSPSLVNHFKIKMRTFTTVVRGNQEPTPLQADTQSSSRFLVAIYAVAILFLALHVNQFFVPDSDFFDYAEKAAKLRQWQWPENFKRPPLYSVLIALFSSVIPGKFADLYAAELIGMLSYLLSIWFLYRIVFRLVPNIGAWVVWFWAFHPLTLRMALKPKPEILVTCLILWAFERYLHDDRRAYAVAFVATTVRYEGALAIGAFFLADLLFTSSKIKAVLRLLASSLFIILWSMVNSAGSGAGGDYSSYFTNYHLNYRFLYTFWNDLLRILPIHLFKFWFVLVMIGFLWGGWLLWQRQRRQVFTMAIFLCSYWVLHSIWPFFNADYVVIASWIAILLIVKGWQNIGELTMESKFIGKAVSKLFATYSFLIVCLLLLIGTILSLKTITFPYPQQQPQWTSVMFTMIPLLVYYWPKRWTVSYGAGFLLLVTLCCFLSFFINSFQRNDLYEIRYAKAEFRLVGEWFEQNRQPGDRLAMTQPGIAAYYTSLDRDRDFASLAEAPSDSEAAFLRWLEQNSITHVAWLSYHLMVNRDNPWAKWVNANRKLGAWNHLSECKDHPGLKCEAILRVGPRWACIYRVDLSSSHNRF